jgi:hypothetical protein
VRNSSSKQQSKWNTNDNGIRPRPAIRYLPSSCQSSNLHFTQCIISCDTLKKGNWRARKHCHIHILDFEFEIPFDTTSTQPFCFQFLTTAAAFSVRSKSLNKSHAACNRKVKLVVWGAEEWKMSYFLHPVTQTYSLHPSGIGDRGTTFISLSGQPVYWKFQKTFLPCEDNSIFLLDGTGCCSMAVRR